MNLKELSFASFNLYNLNEPGRALYSNQNGWSPAEFALKIEWTARQLRILKSDVFGFQELWHAAPLAAALDKAGLSAEYDMLVPPQADGSKIVCAGLVRKGLISGTAHWIDTFPAGFVLRSKGDDPQSPLIDVGIGGFSRPLLHFSIKPREAEPEIHVYVCHFKSKAPAKVFNEPWFRADPAKYGKHATALGAALSRKSRYSSPSSRSQQSAGSGAGLSSSTNAVDPVMAPHPPGRRLGRRASNVASASRARIGRRLEA